MKVSLNKEMIEKIKSLKGKMVLVPATFALVAGITLTGCGNADAVEPTTPVTSEVVSEEVSEIVSENEVSEEISEEVVEEETYSAQEVMTLIDNLTAQYQYNDPEHIKALVIAANLDYITEEDLDIILNAYGYTMEDLAALYDECIIENGISNKISLDYSQGNIDTLSAEDVYSNRVTLESVMLNNEDKEMAVWYDSLLIDDSNGDAPYERRAELGERIENCGEELTSAERTIYSYSWGIYTRGLNYTDYLDNSYVNYSIVNVK